MSGRLEYILHGNLHTYGGIIDARGNRHPLNDLIWVM